MLETKRPFTRADAVAAGISPRRLGGSRFRRIFRNVYISASVRPQQEQRVIAALMLHPEGAWASHISAAAWCGVAVPSSSTVHVSVRRAADRRWQPGLKPHVAPVDTKVHRRRGVLVSDPVRMFVELASMLDLVELVAAGDSMLRVFDMRADDLRRGLASTRDYWSPAARYAAQFVRDDVDSPMESRLRMLLVLAGLPEPTVNLKIRDDEGRVIVRFDLAYPGVRLAIEYDGRHHVEILSNWEDDNDRRELLDELEWRILKVRAADIYSHPGRTVERVWRALRQRGLSCPLPGHGWRAHFPDRGPSD